MRKLITILILVCLGVGYYFAIKNRMPEKTLREKKWDVIVEYDKMIDQNYPESPEQVIEANNQLLQYLYGESPDDEKILEIIKMQRKLYDKEFLAINPIDIQLEKIKEEVKIYKQEERRIIRSKQLPPQYNKKEQNQVVVKVLHYTNTTDLYLEYYLRKKTDDRWKILGWKPTQKFIVAEEITNE